MIIPKYTAGRFTSQVDGSTLVSIDQLDKDLVVNLKNMKVGDITQPLTYTDDRGKTAVRIIYLVHKQSHTEKILKMIMTVLHNRRLAKKSNRS